MKDGNERGTRTATDIFEVGAEVRMYASLESRASGAREAALPSLRLDLSALR
jgi:hypothetical protein